MTVQGNSESAHRYHPISVIGGSTACTHCSISSCFKHTLAVINLFKQILQYFKIIKTKYYNYYCSSQQHFTKHLPKRASFYSKSLKVLKLLLSLQQTKKLRLLELRSKVIQVQSEDQPFLYPEHFCQILC